MSDDAIDLIRTAKAAGHKLAALTAYDYPIARLVDESSVDIVLVGDSLGMVVLGYPDTTYVTMDDMLHHTRAAARGVKRALLVADLPFHTYDTPGQAVKNARALVDAGARAVKLEGGLVMAAQIETIVRDGIPVMGHIGMLPQGIREEGGYKIKGRSPAEAATLLADAQAVERAGAFSVVLEIVATEAARNITDNISIPTIGIGSGPHCDGQILVTYDLIGLFPWFKPKFVSPQAQVADQIRAAIAAFRRDVSGRGAPARGSEDGNPMSESVDGVGGS